MTDLINLYRQAEDYFFRGISSKCMDLGDGAHAYMTGGAKLNFIYITRKTNALDKILIQASSFLTKTTFRLMWSSRKNCARLKWQMF